MGRAGTTGQVESVKRGREKGVKTANTTVREEGKLWIYRGIKEWETTTST